MLVIRGCASSSYTDNVETYFIALWPGPIQQIMASSLWTIGIIVYVSIEFKHFLPFDRIKYVFFILTSSVVSPNTGVNTVHCWTYS